MAPTTCRGFSAARAARNWAPAESWARGLLLMARSLRLRADLYDSATGNFPVQILLERAGELVERNRPAHDARQVPRGEIGGDSPPDLESLRARSRGRIDSEKVHAAQNEWHDGGLEIGAAGEPHACDVSPEIDLAGQPGEDVTA